MIPEPIKKRAAALRTALEAGEINIHELRSFFLLVEAEPISTDPAINEYSKWAEIITRKSNRKRKNIEPNKTK